jgi:hypothetical protein
VIAAPFEPSVHPTENVLLERMVFAWWNTSLSPVGNERSDDRHKEIAGNIVKSLINDFHVDCLALGEVTDANLKFLLEKSDKKSLASFDGTHRQGKLQFDTGVIYDSDRLTIMDHESFTNSHAKRSFKVAHRIDFGSFSSGCLFHIFVSHWPSRGGSGGQEENIQFREKIADRLLEQVQKIDEQSPNAAIILLGDFNDEPFDKSLSSNLTATRDRHLTKTKKALLYNPFWRQLGESEPHSFLNPKKSAAGSYFYRKGTFSRWHTFDQILFSAAFLGNSEWHLNEQGTIILRPEFLIDLVQNENFFFDHLPVLGAIERKIYIE